METVCPDRFQTCSRLSDNHIRIMQTYKIRSFRRLLTDNYLLRAFKHHAQQSAYPCRTGTDYKDRVLMRNFRYPGCPKTGGKHISDKKSLLIADTLRNQAQSAVSKRDTHIFSLSSVNPASQCPPAVRISAIVHISLSAEKALAAESLHIHGNTVSRPHTYDLTSDLFHDTDHLMPYRYSRDSTRHTAMLYMQVTRAYAPESHPDDSITGTLQTRPRFFLHFEPAALHVCICKHFSFHSRHS